MQNRIDINELSHKLYEQKTYFMHAISEYRGLMMKGYRETAQRRAVNFFSSIYESDFQHAYNQRSEYDTVTQKLMDASHAWGELIRDIAKHSASLSMVEKNQLNKIVSAFHTTLLTTMADLQSRDAKQDQFRPRQYRAFVTFFEMTKDPKKEIVYLDSIKKNISSAYSVFCIGYNNVEKQKEHEETAKDVKEERFTTYGTIDLNR